MKLPNEDSLFMTCQRIRRTFRRFYYAEVITHVHGDGSRIHYVPTQINVDESMYGWYAPFSNPIMARNFAHEQRRKENEKI